MTNARDIRRKVFFPLYQEKLSALKERGTSLAHYTTAATAQMILRNREIWMRSPSVMNDYSEVRHGIESLGRALHGAPGDQLKAAIDTYHPGLGQEAVEKFEAVAMLVAGGTFIASFSEHSCIEEPAGRLSMWRAYGGTCGVALIFKQQVFTEDINIIGLQSSPVAYLDEAGVAHEVMRIASQVQNYRAALGVLGREAVLNALLDAFRFACVCIKHPAFKEEMEWRVILNPAFHADSAIRRETETIGGIPQLIYKIPLEDDVDRAVFLSVAACVESVLIGPTNYANTIRNALCEELKARQHPDPDTAVRVTNIPLRPAQR